MFLARNWITEPSLSVSQTPTCLHPTSMNLSHPCAPLATSLTAFIIKLSKFDTEFCQTLFNGFRQFPSPLFWLLHLRDRNKAAWRVGAESKHRKEHFEVWWLEMGLKNTVSFYQNFSDLFYYRNRLI